MCVVFFPIRKKSFSFVGRRQFFFFIFRKRPPRGQPTWFIVMIKAIILSFEFWFTLSYLEKYHAEFGCHFLYASTNHHGDEQQPSSPFPFVTSVLSHYIYTFVNCTPIIIRRLSGAPKALLPSTKIGRAGQRKARAEARKRVEIPFQSCIITPEKANGRPSWEGP